MDSFTIINYQGSKKHLLDFIHNNLDRYINEKDVILDIFAGTSSVAYSYKGTNVVYANDAEEYASTIARALLLDCKVSKSELDKVLEAYNRYKNPDPRYETWIDSERAALDTEDVDILERLYSEIPTVWKTGAKWFNSRDEYSLIVKYYSTSYFGIKQARDIDALRYAIEEKGGAARSVYLAALFYAMKESVLSKDGHMAQPLDLKKNKNRLFRLRNKNICSLFIQNI